MVQGYYALTKVTGDLGFSAVKGLFSAFTTHVG
jgi:hypothetical protein